VLLGVLGAQGTTILAFLRIILPMMLHQDLQKKLLQGSVVAKDTVSHLIFFITSSSGTWCFVF
jgi:hypothetical protein